MKSVNIKLPAGDKIANLTNGVNFSNSSQTNKILSVFQSGDNKSQQLSSDELQNALNFFLEQEQNIAVQGKAGDGYINSKDIELIAQNEKFAEVRKQYKTDKEFQEALEATIEALAAAGDVSEGSEIDIYDGKVVTYRDETTGSIHAHTTTAEEISNQEIDGQQVVGYKKSIKTSGLEVLYATDSDNNVLTKPKDVAKACGLKPTFLTRLGLGNVYYRETAGRGNRLVERYYDWNPKDSSFEVYSEKSVGYLGSDR